MLSKFNVGDLIIKALLFFTAASNKNAGFG